MGRDMNTTRYMIIEDNELFDGMLFTDNNVLRALTHCDLHARVYSFDIAEAARDGATSLRDVTEEITIKGILTGHLDEEQPNRIGSTSIKREAA
jgi:hypothetical protein